MKTHPVGAERFCADRWIDRQMGKWTDRQTNTDRQTDREKQTDSYAEANIQFLHCILNTPKV